MNPKLSMLIAATLFLFCLISSSMLADVTSANGKGPSSGAEQPSVPGTNGSTTQPTGGTGCWQRTVLPGSTGENYLRAVAAVSANNVWAVGTVVDATGAGRTLTMRWNGTVWSIVASPNVGPGSNFLTGVAAVSASDIWAVGYFNDGRADQTLILRWNGTAWNRVFSPNFGAEGNYLHGVTAVASNDIWAVGRYYDAGNSAYRTLTMRWNGTDWLLQNSSNVGLDDNYLNAVDASAGNSVWAVGHYFNGTVSRTLIMRWNGSVWSVVSSPNPGSEYNTLAGVTALSATDAWAVGRYRNTGGVYQTLTMRWNGTAWSVVNSPQPGMAYNGLLGVAAASGSDVWAVGSYRTGATDEPLAMRWNGSVWEVNYTPSNPGESSILQAASAVSATDVWAVGNNSSGTQSSLAMHYPGPCPPTPTPTRTPTLTTATPTRTPTRTPTPITPTPTTTPVSPTPTNAPGSPIPTNTPGGPTPTTTPISLTPTSTPVGPTPTSTPITPTPTNTPVTSTPTSTPIPAPTACPLQFTDVLPNNTFYPQVRCLACRGIDLGFPCGGSGEPCDPQNNNYWRINSLITRDDLAHMVAGAAGFTEPPGPQRFEDVPLSHLYFPWINRMFNRGLIGGYPCGGPGEPCVPPLNLGYYRPHANATRGQISKIVSNGAGYNEPPLGQFFTDVPPGSPFYEWVQRLTNRGVMSGYPCGGPNEPCDAQNRPYFRWQNDSTRGQVGKITANTFFPSCSTP